MKRTAATIWGWGERFEDVRINSEKYVSKKWKPTVKECSIDIIASERSEGISYYITAYVSNPKSVGDLAENLFYAAFVEKDTKVHLVEIQLFDTVFSKNLKYRDTLEEVEKVLKECEKILVSKFMNHPKVREVARGRKVKIIPQIDLLCELESKIANKITMEIIHEDFSLMKNLLHSLSNGIIKENLSERILGYKLGRNIGNYKVGDIDVWGDEVTIWLV